MVSPSKFEFRSSQSASPHRDVATGGAPPEQATRLLSDHEHVDSRRGDIGGAISISPDLQEFFVTSPPALALAQQFQRQRPEFIAVHDIGSHWSRRLLAGIAAASGKTVAQFDIRQEGSGAILARIEYVECPTNDATSLRLYSTDIVSPAGQDPAWASSREHIALTLLAYARLGVAVVGDMPITAMRSALSPLNQAMQQGPWPSRQLLLLPLTSAGALASLGSEFSEDTGVTVRSTPQVSRIGDAWSFISGTWNRLREELMRRESGYGGQGIKLPALPGARRATTDPARTAGDPAPAQPESARPPGAPVERHDSQTDRPFTGSASPTTPRSVELETARLHVARVGQLAGLVACTVCSWPIAPSDVEAPGDAHYVAKRGPMSLDPPSRDALAAQARALLAQLERTGQALDAGSAVTDAMISTSRGHLFLRPVPHTTGLVLIALFTRADKPMLYDLQLQRAASELRPPP